MTSPTHVLFISGRTGVGKTSTLNACHDILAEHNVRHAAIEGDYLDMSHPPLWKQNMSLQNLSAMVTNYENAGIDRFLYSNSVAILESDHLATAFSGEVVVINVLLALDPDTASQRLIAREFDEVSEATFSRQRHQSKRLAESAPTGTVVLDITGKVPHDVARELLTTIGWIGPSPASDRE